MTGAVVLFGLRWHQGRVGIRGATWKQRRKRGEAEPGLVVLGRNFAPSAPVFSHIFTSVSKDTDSCIKPRRYPASNYGSTGV